MNRKRVSSPELAALGKSQGTIERISNFRDQARNHNLGRNLRVVRVLMHLARMAEDCCQLHGEVECVTAERQSFSSPRTGTQMGLPAAPSQAAHFLPGQIRVGGRNVWELASDYSGRSSLEFLFAEVEHLPVDFNQADSAAERKGERCGLAASFAAACAVLIKQFNSQWIGAPRRPLGELGFVPHPHSPVGRMFNWGSVGVPHPDSPAARVFDWSRFGMAHPGSPSTLSSDFGNWLQKKSDPWGNLNAMGLVVQGFEVWHSGAKDALKLAATVKRDKPGLPPLEGNPFDGYTPESISRRSTAENSLWNQGDAIRILQYYLEDQEQRTAAWARGACGRSPSELWSHPNVRARRR